MHLDLLSIPQSGGKKLQQHNTRLSGLSQIHGVVLDCSHSPVLYLVVYYSIAQSTVLQYSTVVMSVLGVISRTQTNHIAFLAELATTFDCPPATTGRHCLPATSLAANRIGALPAAQAPRSRGTF